MGRMLLRASFRGQQTSCLTTERRIPPHVSKEGESKAPKWRRSRHARAFQKKALAFAGLQGFTVVSVKAFAREAMDHHCDLVSSVLIIKQGEASLEESTPIMNDIAALAFRPQALTLAKTTLVSTCVCLITHLCLRPVVRSFPIITAKYRGDWINRVIATIHAGLSGCVATYALFNEEPFASYTQDIRGFKAPTVVNYFEGSSGPPVPNHPTPHQIFKTSLSHSYDTELLAFILPITLGYLIYDLCIMAIDPEVFVDLIVCWNSEHSCNLQRICPLCIPGDAPHLFNITVADSLSRGDGRIVRPATLEHRGGSFIKCGLSNAMFNVFELGSAPRFCYTRQCSSYLSMDLKDPSSIPSLVRIYLDDRFF